jgi:hypothetical protein
VAFHKNIQEAFKMSNTTIPTVVGGKRIVRYFQNQI